MSNKKLQTADLFLTNRGADSYTSIFGDIKENVLDSHIVQSPTPPTSATYPDLTVGTIWVDTSQVPPKVLIWGGTSWEELSGELPVVDPDPSDVSFNPPVSGSGTQTDPYIMTPSTSYTVGGTVESNETITISNQGETTTFFIQTLSGGASFTQPVAFTDAGGSWTGKLTYTDTIEANTGTTYDAEFKIGQSSVFIKWSVVQIANQTPIVGGDGTTPAPNASPPDVVDDAEELYGTGTGVWSDGNSTLRVVDSNLGDVYTTSIVFGVNGAMDASNKSISDGDTLTVAFVETDVNNAANGDQISGALTNDDGYFQIFSLVKLGDGTSLLFDDLTDQPLNDEVTSNLVQGGGHNVPIQIDLTDSTLTDVQVSIAGGTFTSVFPATVNPGDSIQVKGTTGADSSFAYTADFTYGSEVTQWSVTTVDIPATIVQPQITSPADHSTNLSPTITLSSTDYVGENGAGPHTSSTWEVYESDLDLPVSEVITDVNSSEFDNYYTVSGSLAEGEFNGKRYLWKFIRGSYENYTGLVRCSTERSEDGGKTWIKLAENYFGSVGAGGMVPSWRPTAQGMMYHGGRLWQWINQSNTNDAFKGNSLNRYSVDGGVTWLTNALSPSICQLTGGTAIGGVTGRPDGVQVMVASTAHSCPAPIILTSKDSGENWTSQGAPEGYSSYGPIIMPWNGGNALFVITGHNNVLYVSPDGENWTSHRTGLPGDGNIHKFMANSDTDGNLMIMDGSKRFFTKAKGSSTWIPVGLGKAGPTEAECLGYHGTRGKWTALTIEQEKRVYWESDDGEDWEKYDYSGLSGTHINMVIGTAINNPNLTVGYNLSLPLYNNIGMGRTMYLASSSTELTFKDSTNFSKFRTGDTLTEVDGDTPAGNPPAHGLIGEIDTGNSTIIVYNSGDEEFTEGAKVRDDQGSLTPIGEPTSETPDPDLYTPITPDSEDLTTASLTASELTTGKAYYSRVKYADNTTVESEFSPYHEFTTRF